MTTMTLHRDRLRHLLEHWYPSCTKTYLIVRRDQPCPGPDFVRVEGLAP